MLTPARRAAACFLVLLSMSMAGMPVARAEGKPEDKVWMTKAGRAYHLKDCRIITRSKEPKEMTRGEAEKKGAKPCKICKP